AAQAVRSAPAALAPAPPPGLRIPRSFQPVTAPPEETCDRAGSTTVERSRSQGRHVLVTRQGRPATLHRTAGTFALPRAIDRQEPDFHGRTGGEPRWAPTGSASWWRASTGR